LPQPLGIESLSELGDEIRIKSGPDFKGDPNSVVTLISRMKNLTIHPSEPSILRLRNEKLSEEEKLSQLQNLLLQIELSKRSRNSISN
jgi:transcription-repair coupling factor (superfamily II helicase)